MAFSYRVKIPVTASADGAQTNYQMKLTIVKGTGSNTAGTIYLNDHAANWPYDIQFKNASGTVMDYWREEYDATDMTVWVECDSIAASGNTTFYLYYGDSGASDASDGEDTFIFYNDCSDLSDWDTYTAGSGALSISSGRIKFYNPTGNANKASIASKTTVMGATGGVATHFTIRLEGTNDYTLSFYLSPTTLNNIAGDNLHGVQDFANYSGYGTVHIMKDGGSQLFAVEHDSVLSLNNDYKVEVRSKSGNQSYLVNGTSRNSQTKNYDFDNPSYLTFFTVAPWNASGTYYIDDVYVRKWTYNEPAWASPGSEESAGIDFDSLLFFPRKYRGPDDLSFLELS